MITADPPSAAYLAARRKIKDRTEWDRLHQETTP